MPFNIWGIFLTSGVTLFHFKRLTSISHFNKIVSIFPSNSLILCLERKINNLYAPRSVFITFNLLPLS